MSLLDEAKKVFLTDDLDGETYQHNLGVIREWERSMLNNEALVDWREHDVTKKLNEKAKAEYMQASLRLMRDRDLSEQTRMSLYAKQDACTLIFELSGGNAVATIEEVEKEIKREIALRSG